MGFGRQCSEAILLIFLVFLFFHGVLSGGKNVYKVKSPCAATRHVKSNLPTIRVIDELNEEPGVLLGQEGLQYYTLLASRIQREVVIECSSSHTPVKWIYRGVGVTQENIYKSVLLGVNFCVKIEFNNRGYFYLPQGINGIQSCPNTLDWDRHFWSSTKLLFKCSGDFPCF